MKKFISMNDKTQEIINKYGNQRLFRCIIRFNKFKTYNYIGSSFYDYIRIHEYVTIYRQYDRIPIAYFEIIGKPELGLEFEFNYFMFSISRRITHTEFMYNVKIRDKLLNNHISTLSQNKYIPITYILSKQELNCEWNYIARYNRTIREQDLQTTVLNEYTELSGNKAVLIEWILAPRRKSWDWDWDMISERITIQEILGLGLKLLNKLNWAKIGTNKRITPEMIRSHPELPWEYKLYSHPDITYATDHTVDICTILTSRNL